MKNEIQMINFFDLKEEDLIVLNPYNFNDAIKRLENLTLEDAMDDLKYFQKKEFEFRNYEEESSYTLENAKFLTSSKNEKGENEFFLLQDLSKYLISDKELQDKIEKEKDNKNKEPIDKKIILEIKSKEGGKKEILLKCFVDPLKLSENIIKNFLEKSPFKQTSENAIENFYKNINEKIEKYNCKLTIVINMVSLNKIYYNKNKGEYFFDFQSPPIFRTNFYISNDEEEKKKDNYYPKDENSLFPFRNFEDEMSNLKYRHFILMIKKNLNNESTPKDESDINFDTNDELNNTLENMFKNRNGETNEEKYINMEVIPKPEDKNMKNISEFFKYESNKDIRRKLKDLHFLRKIFKEEEKEKFNEKYNDEEAIKLFYQVLALISECILSYYNAVEFLDKLLYKNKYRQDIFSACTDNDFPLLFNITLTKILDKFQNSLKELNLVEFENEMKNTFDSINAQYESTDDLDEVLKPSKNEILMRVQRCVITPTYILFTPYVLDQGNRILREFIKSVNYSMLCTFKMDSLEEARWNNSFLTEYIKFIMSKGFFIGEKKFKFFNYSQSQFRNMSCWLLTDPEEILSKIGDFSAIKQISKFGARISQTLTTTIKTITIPKDKIVYINDVTNEKYTFSDGVGKISVILSEQISNKLELDYIPSCFQGRFLGCKGVWTTMWDDKTGQIYCRKSQIKFKVEPDEINNYFELCDYSRYIQSYLNRQIIILLNALGIKDEKFEKKLYEYKNKLNDQKFVLSLIHYSEWNQMFHRMNACGINRMNDRLSRSIIESNLDILYNDIKKKARIYVEESAYVIGIMDEYNILEYGEAYLQIKRDDFSIILDKKCVVAKCPCLHPGDIRVLTFKKYKKNDKSTKKYEIFNKYENVIIFPSKGERPHPDECSGSDLDGDNYFIFYDSDLIPTKTEKPMSYLVEKKKEDDNPKFTIDNVIEYFATYTNYNNLGLIGDAHLAISDKEGADCPKALELAHKFSKAVDAPKTGDAVKLDEDEKPKEFPHYMNKNKKKSYHSINVLGKLYDKASEFISKRIRLKELIEFFYDKDLRLEGWQNYAFLALIYYRDYFVDLLNLLIKNEINGESVFLTGNNIDNENSILSKKKHNYDLREKIGFDIHSLFIKNKENFYDAIKKFFIKNINKKDKKKGKEEINNKIKEHFLFNNELNFMNNYNLFASACYMISYNLIEEILNKKIKKEKAIYPYYAKFQELINDNLITDNDLEELNEISEYETENLGIDNYECYELSYSYFYDKKKDEAKNINDIIEKRKNDMVEFLKALDKMPIPKQANEENKYRILSFPWCISGIILTNIKFLNNKLEY